MVSTRVSDGISAVGREERRERREGSEGIEGEGRKCLHHSRRGRTIEAKRERKSDLLFST